MSSRFPSWLTPMAATLTRERFVDPEWVFERKLDGIRLLAFKQGSDVQLLSRNRLPQNDAYPSFVTAIAKLAAENLILDGEATGVWNARDPLGYHVFDVLWRDDRDLTTESLDVRRGELMKLKLRAPLKSYRDWKTRSRGSSRAVKVGKE